MRYLLSIFTLIIIVFLGGCDNDRLFEEKRDFPERYWTFNDPATFQFEITNLQYKYDFSLNVRTTAEYKFQNLYIQYYLEDTTGRLVDEGLKNILLFHPVTGMPMGDGMGSYDVTRTFIEDFTFTKRGKYTLRLDQFMRIDTLKEVLSVGFRVEKGQ